MVQPFFLEILKDLNKKLGEKFSSKVSQNLFLGLVHTWALLEYKFLKNKIGQSIGPIA